MTQQPHDTPQASEAAQLDSLVSDAADAAIAEVRQLGVSESQLSDAEIIDLLSETITAELEDQ
jgi:hypothetical protein